MSEVRIAAGAARVQRAAEQSGDAGGGVGLFFVFSHLTHRFVVPAPGAEKEQKHEAAADDYRDQYSEGH
jgi:hypothetical protein